MGAADCVASLQVEAVIVLLPTLLLGLCSARIESILLLRDGLLCSSSS
jgi:hypothetical protein